jgi:hypothetical protein
MKKKKGLKRDPVEKTLKYFLIKRKLEKKISERMSELEYSPRERGRLYDEIKKEILLENYGIEWKSPRELNPRVRFD